MQSDSCFFSAPGGTLSDDVTCTEFCLFKAQEDMETMQAYAQVNTVTFLFNFNCCHREVKSQIFQLVQIMKHVLCFL